LVIGNRKFAGPHYLILQSSILPFIDGEQLRRKEGKK